MSGGVDICHETVRLWVDRATRLCRGTPRQASEIAALIPKTSEFFSPSPRALRQNSRHFPRPTLSRPAL